MDTKKIKTFSIYAGICAIALLCVIYFGYVIKLINLILSVVKPLVIGAVIAFAVNIIMKKMEKVAFPEAFLKRWVKATNEKMSEEEIELVVNFKAEVKARDTAFTERMEEQRRANEETLKINASIAAAAKAQLAELQQMAFDRLKAVENG